MDITEYLLFKALGRKLITEDSVENKVKLGFNAYSNRDYLLAISYFDKARELGYIEPGMYYYYVLSCRKLKMYDKELEIIDEALAKFESSNDKRHKTRAKEFIKRKERVIELLNNK